MADHDYRCASHLVAWGDQPITPDEFRAAGCASDATNLDQTLSQIAVATEWGRLGLNFVRSGLNNANRTEGSAYLDALAAVGEYALWQTPIDDVALSTSFWDPVTRTVQPANECPPIDPLHPERKPCAGPGADPTQRCCRLANSTMLWRSLQANFSWLKQHQAYAGAYGCDDCCHVGLNEKAWVEYGNIAKVKDMMLEIDPHHFIFGTIACDNLWMWSEAPGAGLGLDVVMKENYGSAVEPEYWDAFQVCGSRQGCRKDGSNGAALQQGPMPPGGRGTGIQNAHHRNFPMTWEPIWNMPDPGQFNTPQQAMTFAWRDLVISGEVSTNWFVYNVATSRHTTLVNQLIPHFQQQVQELLPSLQSKARFNHTSPLPVAVITASSAPPIAPATVNGPAAAVLRLYAEEVPHGYRAESWYCMHLVALSTQPQPQTLSYKLIDLPYPTWSQSITAWTVFDENYAVPFNVSSNGTAEFVDSIGSFGVKVYRIGCPVAVADPTNLVLNGGFETRGTNAEGWSPQHAVTASWAVSCFAPRNISGYYPFCDPRLSLRASTAAPRSGRHAARIQIPTRDVTAVVDIPQQHIPAQEAAVQPWRGTYADKAENATTLTRTQPAMYTAELWARSSPARVNATLEVGAPALARTESESKSAGRGAGPGVVVSTSTVLSAGRWTRLIVNFTNERRGTAALTARVVLRPTVGVAATVWIDDVSIRETRA